MARSSSEDTAGESILMSDGLDRDTDSRGSSRFRASAETYDDEDDDYYFNYMHSIGPRRPSSFKRVLDFVGMNGRQRRRDYSNSFRASSSGEALHGLLARPSGRRRAQRESRSCRKGFVVGTIRRVLLFTPFVILMLFGVLHIIQSSFGSAQLLWDYDDDDLWLPEWGRPGHAGDGLAEYPTDATRDVMPIPCHSHNDYWRRVPLFDAIHWGCTSVEADVWVFDDDLFVGHSTQSLTRDRTLRSLYIDPIVELLDSMNITSGVSGNSSATVGVFEEVPDQTLVLLVDIKSEPYSTYRILEQQLEPLRQRDYLSYHDGTQMVKRAVTVVGTGNTPFDIIADNSEHREIFFDAPLDLLWEAPASPVMALDPSDTRPNEMDYATAMTRAPANKTHSYLLSRPDIVPISEKEKPGIGMPYAANDFNSTNSYYASAPFSQSVGFVWRGRLSPRQYEIIRGQIRGARSRGLKVRYWDTPAWPISARNHIWQVLMDEGADILNVDDLRGAAQEDWRRRVHRWWS